jgi:hypothetical protein
VLSLWVGVPGVYAVCNVPSCSMLPAQGPLGDRPQGVTPRLASDTTRAYCKDTWRSEPETYTHWAPPLHMCATG